MGNPSEVTRWKACCERYSTTEGATYYTLLM